MERANVEARIAVLRDVQKLLDSAVLRLNQYSAVMAVLRWVGGGGVGGIGTLLVKIITVWLIDSYNGTS